MEDETLDEIEVPLRRLFASKDADYNNNSDDLLLPTPPVPYQIVQIKFIVPHHQHRFKESESHYQTINLSLSVDPGPGCGGIAWPAGEVGPHLIRVAYCHRYRFSSYFVIIPFCPNVRHLQVLASYIARRGLALRGLHVLELGSGTGLVGLIAGHLGARVCITDQGYVLAPILFSLYPDNSS
jgi:hypothetical protein